MRYRNWKTKSKFNPSNYDKKNSKRNKKNKDEMKGTIQDDADLKKKKKRLTINWFFRPKDD